MMEMNFLEFDDFDTLFRIGIDSASRVEGTFYVITFCVYKSFGTQFEWY